MSQRIGSMADLPQDVQDQESATFDYGQVRTLLLAAYYRGPAVNDDDSHRGLRASALRGSPSSHRSSILRKAENVNLVEETPEGYATTDRGLDLLEQMMICEDCGGDQSIYAAVQSLGRHRGYIALVTICLSCHDDPTSSSNVSEYNRNDEGLEKAVDAMENHSVVCYLNGMSLDQAKSHLGMT